MGKSKQKCISNCIKKETLYIHPITSAYVFNTTGRDICLIDPYIDENKKIQYFKTCEYDEVIDKNTFFIPDININCAFFLKLIYNLQSFEQVISWVKEYKDLPYYTKVRILNCSWKLYFDEIRSELYTTSTFYKYFINTYWKQDLIDNDAAENIEELIFENDNNYNLVIEKTLRKLIKNIDSMEFDVHDAIKEYVQYYIDKIYKKVKKFKIST
jgi:hypothetical protein